MPLQLVHRHGITTKALIKQVYECLHCVPSRPPTIPESQYELQTGHSMRSSRILYDADGVETLGWPDGSWEQTQA